MNNCSGLYIAHLEQRKVKLVLIANSEKALDKEIAHFRKLGKDTIKVVNRYSYDNATCVHYEV